MLIYNSPSMKMNYILPLLLIACFTACGSSSEQNVKKLQFTVINTLDIARKDALLMLSVQELSKKFPIVNWKKIKFRSTTEIPFQVNDIDSDGKIDEIILVFDIAANEMKMIEIVPLKKGETAPTFKKRTQAELSHKINGKWKGREYEGGTFKNVNLLRVPSEHKDHSWFIRYEGPGWESDLVGYRFYLDQRNATDIFGKKTREMVLQNVGQDGFDSYHELSAWGMDILKVGPSLGIGSLGIWLGKNAQRVELTDSLTCQITNNGNLQSAVVTKYYGWKAGSVSTDVSSRLSIEAGSRLTKHEISLSRPLPNLCTGIVKLPNSNFFENKDNDWAYIATWGKQSLAEDHLGLAVIFEKSNMLELTADENSHVVVLSPNNNQLSYYFLGAWEQEPGGIQTQEAFIKYLGEVVSVLSNPLVVKFD